jgi:hypothetical protein
MVPTMLKTASTTHHHPAPEDRPPTTASLRRNPAVVSQRMATGTVLVHMASNRIYELSTTAGRLWELLDGKSDLRVIQQQLLSEFEVEDAVLGREIGQTLDLLRREDLVVCI